MLSCFSHVRLFAAPWTATSQAPLSMGFSRQEYWSGLACPLPGDLPNQRIEPVSLTSPALVGGSLPLAPLWEAFLVFYVCVIEHVARHGSKNFTNMCNPHKNPRKQVTLFLPPYRWEVKVKGLAPGYMVVYERTGFKPTLFLPAGHMGHNLLADCHSAP